MFEEISEIVENCTYLQAVSDNSTPNVELMNELPPYHALSELEKELKSKGDINFEKIWSLLTSDYASAKGIFIEDVETYKSLKDEPSRLIIANKINERFLLPSDENSSISSVFVKEQVHIDTNSEPATPYRVASLNTPNIERDSSLNIQGTLSFERSCASFEEEAVLEAVQEMKEEHHEAEKKSHPILIPLASNTDYMKKDSSESPDIDATPSRTFATIDEDFVDDDKDNTRDRNQSIPGIIGGEDTNAIGVFGKPLIRIKQCLRREYAPVNLFDDIAEMILNDLRYDMFYRFLDSSFYKQYIRTKHFEKIPVGCKDFITYRVLGRGAFGAVNACKKTNTGKLYAVKCINKKRAASHIESVIQERDVLAAIDSKFVVCLKYATQDKHNLFLVLDLMTGGDLKFHLNKVKRFSENRARFYAAELLLGLEHMHRVNMIYRDMKPENALLDADGHCRISDLGLSVITKYKIKGYAGTPGYIAPEVCLRHPYGPSCDLFSFGVILYRLITGRKPFMGKTAVELDKSVCEVDPEYSSDYLSTDCIDLLKGLLEKDPSKRLGANDINDIKHHKWFQNIDFGLLEAGHIDPPWIPPKEEIHAESSRYIGAFSDDKYNKVKLTEEFQKSLKVFNFVSTVALQREMVEILQEYYKGVNFEKFASKEKDIAHHSSNSKKIDNTSSTSVCCSIN